MSRPAPRTLRGLIGTLLAVLVVGLGAAASPAVADDNVVTPGDFTGYGFDQCLAPTQSAMDAWLTHSPFLAVGIYISGDSRACRNQPNLTPTWVTTQLAKGWRLLPITLGPQASCQPRFPRYGDDETINPKPGKYGRYKLARDQGTAEAVSAVAAAQALGIVAGSTLWYDLEGFDLGNTRCRESALRFLSAWTTKLHGLGYVSGVYSSAGSGILMLDNARVDRPGTFALPDQIWIARWDGEANTSTSYIREDGWHPHARVKQYQGGHDETWGNVRINIDRNFLDLGQGSVAPAETHCKGVLVNHPAYLRLKPATETRTADPAQVQALQCLLKEKGLYAGKINGTYAAPTIAAANTWQEQHGFEVGETWTKPNWMSLLADGAKPVLKFGSAGPDVRRVQRALNAARPKAQLSVTGVVTAATTTALRAYQSRQGLEVSGVVAGPTWKALRAGLR
ncbi:DUF1906 domain-containing protein [Nocardioides sp. KIGAM211]|uniref:DUF1906 domain-containing protein n=1 Tax=Nocardioides luti TaxID=2761101 RepID=A0A7X0RHJ2_9ACTN|nr:glycoside hydrolase domain-containing protein [Nocardioides luti]MBB6628402.1 DUF1906 domain-containing protein [Nocardioides luti]